MIKRGEMAERGFVPGVEMLVVAMRQRESVRLMLAFLQMGLGMGWALLGPLLMAVAFWMALAKFGIDMGWWKLLGITMLILLPVQFWSEWRSQGAYLSRQEGLGGMSSSGDGSLWLAWSFAAATGSSSSRMMYAFVGRGGFQGAVELLLWGPRQVFEGWARWRAMHHLRGVDVPRAAVMLQALLEQPRGVPLDRLLCGGETHGDVIPALAYVAFYEWAGVGTEGQRVWALTETRREFGLAG